MNTKTALITGANGFIGSNLVGRLYENGWQIKALVLKGTSLEFIEKYRNIEIIYGDISSPESIENCCKNVMVVFHLAALAKDWGKPELFFRVNAEGTRNLLNDAVKNKVKRFVLISTLAVHKYSGHHSSNENTPYDCPEYLYYGLSKIKAEEYLNHFHQQKLIEGVIIRPGLFPFGKNDLTSFSKLAKVIESGKFMYINSGKSLLCTSYVENLTYGIELAAINENAAGQTYIISDDLKISWKELISKFSRELKVKKPSLSVPYFLASLIAGIFERIWKTFRLHGEPLITKYRVSLMKNDLYFICDKAKRELGYKPIITLDDGIKKTVKWYLDTK